MRFVIEKIEIKEGDFSDRKVRIKLTPCDGAFIKLKDCGDCARYVSNGKFKRYGYTKYPHKIPNYETEPFESYPLYLTFFIGSKKSVDEIQLVDNSEDSNYVYETLRELSAHIYLDEGKFNRMWDALIGKVFPSEIDLFVSHEFYSKYDYYVMPLTPWDLSHLEAVSSHVPGNPFVPILNYGIHYELLETNEYEITKAEEEKNEKLSNLEFNFLYEDSKINVIVSESGKLLHAILRQLGVLALLLFFILLIQIGHLFF
ncbi:MAG: hypothetical protein P8N23_05930 [Methylophilaceae bacterium]|nr:hypothetical protein [Methylophilaceae bacterium]